MSSWIAALPADSFLLQQQTKPISIEIEFTIVQQNPSGLLYIKLNSE